jgi:hypothetical protein
MERALDRLGNVEVVKNQKGGGNMQVERFGDVEVVIKERGKWYIVEWGPYVLQVSHPYGARMAIFALVNVQNELMEKGFVEKVIEWEEKNWEEWDPYRVFEKGEFSVFHKDGFNIDLEVRMIYSFADRKFKVYIRAFLGVYVPLE